MHCKLFKSKFPSRFSLTLELPTIDLNPKMRMFGLLVDFDCQMDTSDFYATSWAVDYLNFLKYSREQGIRPLHFEVGASFTLAITDDLNTHGWGLNDCRQLGKGIQDFRQHY